MSAFKEGVLSSIDPNDSMLMTRGENNHPMLSAAGLGNSLLALFDKFFQHFDKEELRRQLRKILGEAREGKDDEKVINLFVMAFQVRWCRGGKGSKLVFYQALASLYEVLPEAVIALIHLIPSFGYWKDLLLLVEETATNPHLGVNYGNLHAKVWDIYAAELMKDVALLTSHEDKPGKPSISFASKYAPRQKSHFDTKLKAVSCIANRMFPTSAAGDKSVKHRYRDVVTKLTAVLEVPEVKMCEQTYGDIDLSKVPSRCLTKNFKAFANEDLKKELTGEQMETGNRHPDISDRVKCRQNFIEVVTSKESKGLKGKGNYPHEYVEKVQGNGAGMKRMRGGEMSSLEVMALNGQWKAMREDIELMIKKRTEATDADASKPPLLGNIVPLSDVSGSMTGTPMSVSIGLGILCSELANEDFRDLVLCFTDDAKWETLQGCVGFVEKVQKLQRAPWGGSTNFYRALERVCTVVKDKKLKQEQIPNLLVISDMQFDEADHQNWNTAYENIEKMFHDLGKELHGAPFEPPTIIFWDVRSAPGFPAAADQKGVVLLSGYSPSLMKFVLSGEMEEEEMVTEEMEDGEVVTNMKKVAITPEQALRKVLYEEAYQPVREVLGKLREEGKLVIPEGNLMSAASNS